MIHVLRILPVLIVGSLSNCSHALAQGAVTVPGEPVISRMCLWNADGSTWKRLHLKRRQVKQLDQLKLEYPAVVGGQWDVESESVDPMKPQVGPDGHNNGAPAHTTPGQGAPARDPQAIAPAASRSRLQTDLRAVLSAAQLRGWASLCDARYSKLLDPSNSPKLDRP